jgi:hypothetical protein
MKKKICCFSIICGTVLFVLILICIFFNTKRLMELSVHAAIFLFNYWIIAYILIIYWKNMHKIFLYILLPFFLSFILFILAQLLYYRGKIYLYPLSFLFYYFASCFWVIGIASYLIDIILSYFMRKNPYDQNKI